MGTKAKIVQDNDGDAEPEAQKAETSSGEPARKHFVVKARPLGLRQDLNFDKIEEVLDLIEGSRRR